MTSDLLTPLPPSAGRKLLAVNELQPPAAPDPHGQFREACRAWLARSPFANTRSNYDRDLAQFMAFAGIPADRPEHLAAVLPRHVAAWRDSLKDADLTNSSVRRPGRPSPGIGLAFKSFTQSRHFVREKGPSRGKVPRKAATTPSPVVPTTQALICCSPAEKAAGGIVKPAPS